MHDKPINNLVKSLLSSLKAISHDFSHLVKSFKNQKNTPREKSKPYEESGGKPASVIASLSTPIAIRVDAETHERENVWKRIKTGFEIVGIVAVIIYAVVTYQMWREMINATDVNAQAVNEARQNRLQAEKFFRVTIEQSRLDQRAWVGSKGMALTSFGANKELTGTIVINNSGKTFALNTIARIWIYPSPKLVNDLPHPMLKEVSPIAVFPNQEVSISISTPTNPEESDITALKERKLFLYLYGTVVYFDVFKKRHTSEFCGLFDGKKDFLACRFHNTAD